MPTYEYIADDGEVVELVMSIGVMQTREDDKGCITLDDGRKARRKYSVSREDTRGGKSTWPMYSDAAGVGPTQIDEARRESLKMGIPTDFTPDGRAIFTSRLHRKMYCEAVGLYDRNGGYSDPMPFFYKEDKRR